MGCSCISYVILCAYRLIFDYLARQPACSSVYGCSGERCMMGVFLRGEFNLGWLQCDQSGRGDTDDDDSGHHYHQFYNHKHRAAIEVNWSKFN